MEWLTKQKLSSLVCRERLTLIGAAWDLGIADDHLESGHSNPWVDMVLRVRVEPKQMPNLNNSRDISQG